MEVKLATHVYFITTMNKKLPQALFLITTSSLLKLANHSGEICTQVYLCVSMICSSVRNGIKRKGDKIGIVSMCGMSSIVKVVAT